MYNVYCGGRIMVNTEPAHWKTGELESGRHELALIKLDEFHRIIYESYIFLETKFVRN